MNEKIVLLSDWGCDTESAMERMLNDEEFYLDCLYTIATDNNFELLSDAIEASDAQSAFDSAHALKGVFANTGLTPMYGKIVEIVEPLRAGSFDGLTDKTAELFEMKEKLMAILES